MAIINTTTKSITPTIPIEKRMLDSFFLLSTLQYIAERISVTEITPNIIPMFFIVINNLV